MRPIVNKLADTYLFLFLRNNILTSFHIEKTMGILQKKTILLALTTGLTGLVIGLLPFGIELEERIGLSWLFHLRGGKEPPPEVVIISLDKESTQGLGLPDNISRWPRSLHADLVNKLSDQKPAVIAFDINFKESSEEDFIFAQAMTHAKNVVLFQQIERERFLPQEASDSHLPNIHIQRIISPAPLLAQAAAKMAVFPLPKIPVQVSQYWQFKDGNPNLPTLPVAAFQIFSQVQHRPSPPPLFQHQSVYLNFYGPPRTITTISYDQASKLPKPLTFNGKALSLKRKAVFIGLSETTPDRQKDGFYTVFSRADGLDMSGVEIAATAFANLLEDQPVSPLPFLGWILVLLLFGVIIGAICSVFPLVFTIGCAILLLLLYIGLAFFQFKWANTWSPLVIPILIQMPIALLGAIVIHYRRAKETDRLKSEAMAQLSHEIRNPLAATKGYLDNLRDKIAGDLTEKQQSYISRMTMNMDRLNRMVQDQLNLSQIESGKITVSLAPLALYDLLSERVEAMRMLSARKQIEILLHPFEGENVVMGDRDKMDQIFTNLLDNAIKFTPQNGKVTITCHQQGKSLEISIQDPGVGIPIKEQDNIFKRLHQVENGQPKQGKGVGLGLFIVKQLVELQKGTIRVKSGLPDPGTQFIVTFPILPQ
ncbi:MAG: CHASE2 domain-containing protein [Nitrospirota bacterium]